MQAAKRAEKCCFFISGDLGLQTGPSETKQVFHVNLVQISSAVPEIFHTQTKSLQTDSTKSRTFHSSLHAVTKTELLTGKWSSQEKVNPSFGIELHFWIWHRLWFRSLI